MDLEELILNIMEKENCEKVLVSLQKEKIDGKSMFAIEPVKE